MGVFLAELQGVGVCVLVCVGVRVESHVVCLFLFEQLARGFKFHPIHLSHSV